MTYESDALIFRLFLPLFISCRGCCRSDSASSANRQIGFWGDNQRMNSIHTLCLRPGSAHPKLGMSAVMPLSADSCPTSLYVPASHTSKRSRIKCLIFISSTAKDGSTTCNLCAHPRIMHESPRSYVILDRCTPHIWVIFSSTEYPGKWKYSHLEGLTFDAVYVVTGMNAPGAISLTPLKISCPFHGLLLPPRMHTQGELISSRE